jgi:hypothetical protein
VSTKPVAPTPVWGKYRTMLAAQWATFFKSLGSSHQAFKVIQRHGVRDLWIHDLYTTLLVEEESSSVDLQSLWLACPYSTVIVGKIPDPKVDGTWVWPMIPHSLADLADDRAPHIVPVSFDVDEDGDLVMRKHAVAATWDLKALTEPKLFTGSPAHDRVRAALVDAAEVGSRYRTARPRPAKRTVVYTHFDENGVVLYVGITDDPKIRGGSHSTYSAWSQFAATMTGEWMPSREDAELRERELIQSLAPVFNLAHVDPQVARQRRSNYLGATGRLDLLDTLDPEPPQRSPSPAWATPETGDPTVRWPRDEYLPLKEMK